MVATDSMAGDGHECRVQRAAGTTVARVQHGDVRPLDVKVGDRILLGKYSGTDVTLDGEEHLIIREDDILGVVE